ncbi:MAG: aconitate hydratase [Deltaproteobacteria bacterium]|nr:aconitate hydratase [Deltaproteobacteria bacterium]MBN2670883.1 aconitate hydratase [Deltaproteobacteria bacterium]
MAKTMTQKIIEAHLVEGEMKAGEEIALRIDQTLTQDATGTMAYLQLEAIGVTQVKTELSVSYVDHNTLQGDFRNADDHRYLQSVANKHGVVFSRPGNGICHQLHIERFARPGKTLIGSDSHTPTAGGIGSMAMGAGGLDVASAMAGMPFRIKYPKVMGIELTGKLPNWVSAKDVILEVLRRIDVKGGVGYVLEYFGEGVSTLSVPDRATITNMGTETGCTTSIFPSDEITKSFMDAESRGDQWVALQADDDAKYDEMIIINLSDLEPLAACPHSPGNIKPVRELAGTPVQQVGIGSCTNSSLRDMSVCAAMLKGKTISEKLHLVLNPGSRQVVSHLVRDNALNDLVAAGARLLENACGACIGMGAAPSTGAVSVRTYNRNFLGRSGTKDADVYLVSPETAAATALTGVFTDPRTLDMEYPKFEPPEQFDVNDNMFIFPVDESAAEGVKILRGPNIAPLPEFNPIDDVLEGAVILKTEDNITTDHIMPAGAKILPLRSNIPEISKFVFEVVDPEFPARSLENGGGFVVGGENYGQGSSREHAALAPKYLGIKAVIVKSFARIHLANLVNFGIVPLTFENPADYDAISQGDDLTLRIGDLRSDVTLTNRTTGKTTTLKHTLSDLDAQILKAGGKLAWVRTQL